jgi:hypothetical protein
MRLLSLAVVEILSSLFSPLMDFFADYILSLKKHKVKIKETLIFCPKAILFGVIHCTKNVN